MSVRPTITGLKALRERVRNIVKAGRTVDKRLHGELTTVWRDGADQFIRAALIRVAVDTGMSAATFLELARAIKRTESFEFVIRYALAHQKRPMAKGQPQFPGGQMDKSKNRSIPAGAKAGKKAYTFNVGSPKRVVFRFSFQTVVFQYALHEKGSAESSGWNSLEAGIQAFRDYVEKLFAKKANLVVKDYLEGVGHTLRRAGE